MIRIAILDDHGLFANLVGEYIKNNLDYKITGIYSSPEQFLHSNVLDTIDMLILDLGMPDVSGIDVLKTIMQKKAKVKTLVISQFTSRAYIESALKNKANGYIDKNTSGEEILLALETIANGGEYLGKNIQKVLDDKTFGNELKLLTKREKEILRMFLIGKTQQQIADELFIAFNTVKTHKSSINEKLGVHSTQELIQKVTELKLM